MFCESLSICKSSFTWSCTDCSYRRPCFRRRFLRSAREKKWVKDYRIVKTIRKPTKPTVVPSRKTTYLSSSSLLLPREERDRRWPLLLLPRPGRTAVEEAAEGKWEGAEGEGRSREGRGCWGGCVLNVFSNGEGRGAKEDRRTTNGVNREIGNL